MNKARTRLPYRLLTLLALLAASALPAAPASDWAIAGGEIRLALNQGVLAPLGIEAEIVRPLGEPRSSHPFGYRSASFEGLTLQRLEFRAPHGAIEAFTGGHLRYHGGLVLTVNGRKLDVTDFRMTPHPTLDTGFLLLDRSGVAWAELDHGHFEFAENRTEVVVRYANLRTTAELATLAGDPGLAGRVLGIAHFRADVVRSGEVVALRGSQCSDPDWPTDPGFEADISLIGFAANDANDAAAMVRCQDCDGANGRVAVTPNATLENTGSADVPWWRQFTAPQPPYGNDQHPYLVWNLYRLADGRFEQIGVSGLKHAFNSINSGCPCAGGNIVWVGCRDVYSIGSNDIDRFLAPRSEIIPASAKWGRCRSLFDSDCDQVQDGTSDGPFDNRMLVNESDLADPDARYFIEAWYVVRDDVNRFNTMGWREVDPAWTGTEWTFPNAGDYAQGPALDAWTGDGGTAQWDRALVETADGAVSVVVRAFDTGSGWRYDYFVMNHDYMRAETAGAEPNLELLSNVGFTAVELPRDPAGTAGSPSTARADRTRGSDWSGAVAPDAVRWTDPGDTPLDWGRGFRFSLVADAPPGPSTLRLSPGDGSPELGAPILGPALPEPLFDDDFESP